MSWYLGYIALFGILPSSEPNEDVAREHWHLFITLPGIGESLIMGNAECIIDVVYERLYVVRADYIRHIPSGRMPDMRIITARPVFDALRTKPLSEISTSSFPICAKHTRGLAFERIKKGTGESMMTNTDKIAYLFAKFPPPWKIQYHHGRSGFWWFADANGERVFLNFQGVKRGILALVNQYRKEQ